MQDINAFQKNLIEASVNLYLEEIKDAGPVGWHFLLQLAQIITNSRQSIFSEAENDLMESLNIAGSVKTIRKIITHPTPQNDNLLKLTKYDDAETKITKEAVVWHIFYLIEKILLDIGPELFDMKLDIDSNPIVEPQPAPAINFFNECDEKIDITLSPRAAIKKTARILESHGMTNEMLESAFTNTKYTTAYMTIIIYLVTGVDPKAIYKNNLKLHVAPKMPPLPIELRLSPEDAINEVLGLNAQQLSALRRLFIHGVRAQHLRKIPNFSRKHKLELEEMVVYEDMAIDDAIDQLKDLSRDEADNLYDELQVRSTNNIGNPT